MLKKCTYVIAMEWCLLLGYKKNIEVWVSTLSPKKNLSNIILDNKKKVQSTKILKKTLYLN